jgi:predicted house-cleaning NTP pyrophosphatase (Maf/HAM1 superfamily)
MPGSERAIRIEGLVELRRAFKVAGVGMEKDLDDALKSGGEVVRTAAESKAVSEISRIRPPWSSMRVGITRHTVYVAPVARGRKRGRAGAESRRREEDLRFARMLRTEAMDPALDENIERVTREVKDAVRDMARAWGAV